MDQPPCTIDGRYELLEELGRGGMGTVYKARHTLLKTTVAIKLLAAESGRTATLEDQMIVEAQAAARIKHPNVVAVTDVSRTAHGDVFIVMEHIDGVDLEELLTAEAPLEIPRARALLTQIASALAAAHAQGVIHRDVKPANCMIMQGPDGAEIVKILDFGIAKILEDDGSTAKVEPATRPWHTRKYAAPEVKHGSPSSVRSDVYSLGVLAYRMLTGRFPLGDDLVLTPPAQHRPELPAGLCTLLTDMLQTAPHARPRTMDEVRTRLHHEDVPESPLAVRERQTTAPPDTSPDTAPEPSEPKPSTRTPALMMRRGRWVLSVGALSLAVGVVVTLLRADPIRLPPVVVNHLAEPQPELAPKDETLTPAAAEPDPPPSPKPLVPKEAEPAPEPIKPAEDGSERRSGQPPHDSEASARNFVRSCFGKQVRSKCLESSTAKERLTASFRVEKDGGLTTVTVATSSGSNACLRDALVACKRKKPSEDSYLIQIRI